MTIIDVLSRSGLTLVEFSKMFNIPYRTVQSWKLGQRNCPEYLKELIIYKLKKEGKWRE